MFLKLSMTEFWKQILVALMLRLYNPFWLCAMSLCEALYVLKDYFTAFPRATILA